MTDQNTDEVLQTVDRLQRLTLKPTGIRTNFTKAYQKFKNELQRYDNIMATETVFHVLEERFQALRGIYENAMDNHPNCTADESSILFHVTRPRNTIRYKN